MDHVTITTLHFGVTYHPYSNTWYNLHVPVYKKFDNSSFSHSWDIDGARNFKSLRSSTMKIWKSTQMEEIGVVLRVGDHPKSSAIRYSAYDFIFDFNRKYAPISKVCKSPLKYRLFGDEILSIIWETAPSQTPLQWEGTLIPNPTPSTPSASRPPLKNAGYAPW